MSAGGFSKARLSRMHDIMAGHVERGGVPGLVTLISRRGEVHVDAIGTMATSGGEPMRRDTIFRIASMTKPITAAAAMILVEECKLRLDDPVDALLPELSSRKVLKRLEGPLDDTVPAKRPITLRDLLTFRLGMGLLLAPPGQYPMQAAIEEAGLSPGPNAPPFTPDAYMKRVGSLPLIHQPGEAWLYHTGSDILGVLIARAAGQPLSAFLRERIFEPLGMRDTGFWTAPEELNRLPPVYVGNPATGELTMCDDPADEQWARPPVFESGGGGLLSTVDDYLSFCQMMLNKGRHGRERILSRLSVELMTTDHLTPEQKAGAHVLFPDCMGWGFGVGVAVRRDHLWLVPGRFGWDGGRGTSAYSDPKEEMVGILMTQRLMDSPELPPVFLDFWTSAYQAIDD
jgi:CubicO group peptidase (beta-lactamase class C family)